MANSKIQDRPPDWNNIDSPRFALRISTMIQARLIWYKHYFRWADEIIGEAAKPPDWIIETATIRYYPDAVASINRFVNTRQMDASSFEQSREEYLACLFLRNRSGAISWATFLEEAGARADAYSGRHDCSYYYERLTQLEDSEFSRELELMQRAEVELEFKKELAVIEPLYEMFMRYFRDFVHDSDKNEGENGFTLLPAVEPSAPFFDTP